MHILGSTSFLASDAVVGCDCYWLQAYGGMLERLHLKTLFLVVNGKNSSYGPPGDPGLGSSHRGEDAKTDPLASRFRAQPATTPLHPLLRHCSYHLTCDPIRADFCNYRRPSETYGDTSWKCLRRRGAHGSYC